MLFFENLQAGGLFLFRHSERRDAERCVLQVILYAQLGDFSPDIQNVIFPACVKTRRNDHDGRPCMNLI